MTARDYSYIDFQMDRWKPNFSSFLCSCVLYAADLMKDLVGMDIVLTKIDT